MVHEVNLARLLNLNIIDLGHVWVYLNFSCSSLNSDLVMLPLDSGSNLKLIEVDVKKIQSLLNDVHFCSTGCQFSKPITISIEAQAKVIVQSIFYKSDIAKDVDITSAQKYRGNNITKHNAHLSFSPPDSCLRQLIIPTMPLLCWLSTTSHRFGLPLF